MSKNNGIQGNPYIRSMSVTSYGGIDDPELGRNLTGSFHVVSFTDTKGTIRKVCVDIGGHQGAKMSDNLNSQVEVIPDAVVITHAHLDHIARLVVLWKDKEFKGKIYMSQLTKLIGEKALIDTAVIMKTKYNALNGTHLKKLESLKEALRIKNEAGTKSAGKKTRVSRNRNTSGDNMLVTKTPPRSNTKSGGVNGNESENPAMTLQTAEVILAGYKIISQKDITVWNDANKPTPPVFEEKDVLAMMKEVVTISDGEFTEILPSIAIRPYNAGHVLGSKSILFEIQKGVKKKVYAYFSGDLGSYRWKTKPAGEIEVPGEEFPLIFASMESTYAGSTRIDFSVGMDQLERDVVHAARKKLANVFACFSLDRAQRVLHELLLLQKKNGWKFPIYMDSPLAVAYTELYREYAADSEFRESMENVHIIVDKDMRKTLMKHKNFRVIITSSGMAEGGPILAYLSQWVENERVEFSFPGYMAENTLGWKLAVRKLKLINLPEEERDERKLHSGAEGDLQQHARGSVVVEAKINHYTHFSGHADEKDLFRWYTSLPKAPGMKLSIVHGVREGSSQSFLNTMKRKRMNVTNVGIPRLQEEVIVF